LKLKNNFYRHFKTIKGIRDIKCNLLFNPDYAIGIVTRVESAMKTDIPASIFFENVVTPTVKRKYEEIAVFAAISARSRLSIA
jgi:S1-C subfamily serine protease